MKTIIVVIVLLGIIITFQPASAIGIGISPSEISIDNVLRGNEAERSLTIFNTGLETTNFTLSSSGHVCKWVTFYDPDDPATNITIISIPGQEKRTVIIKVQIPEDTLNAKYVGSIDVRSIPVAANNNGMGQQLIIGASSSIELIVTGNQTLKGVVTAIVIEDTEPGYPVKIKTIFKNEGNVIAIPEIDVIIHQGNNDIFSFTNDEVSVKPTITEPIIAKWSTTAANLPGEYTAKVTVILDEQILRSDTIPFEILPIGTLTRQGNLTEILIDDTPAIGTLLKVKSLFENNGLIETSAKFTAEVYKDDNLVDTITSDELVVEKNEEIELISYLKIEDSGDYRIEGKVIYDKKETPVKELSFEIPAESIPGFESISTLIIFLIFIKFYNRR
ncbi:MAG: hypothetical protein U9P81_07080 [Euryarchaeota archaeon]|nr:hypothetical protein [Euryarchaeota archaeon]